MKTWADFEFWLHCKGWSPRALRCRLAYFIYPKFYGAPFKIGEEVFDDLTGKKARVTGLSMDDGITYHYDNKGNNKKVRNACVNWAIYLDNDYIDGGRFPWEVTNLKRGY